MVGYKEMPRARNAVRADVLPVLTADAMHLIVFKQRHGYFARHPDDPYVLASVVPVDTENKRKIFVCTSVEQARRLGYRGD